MLLELRDRDVLECLLFAVENHETIGDGSWVRPLDCGGYNGSDHSYRLGKLERLGLAQARRRGGYSRGSKEYTITKAGRVALYPEA